jgi:hypothetical protein
MGSGEEAGTRPSFNGVRWSRDDACDIEHVAIGNRAGRRQRSQGMQVASTWREVAAATE